MIRTKTESSHVDVVAVGEKVAGYSFMTHWYLLVIFAFVAIVSAGCVYVGGYSIEGVVATDQLELEAPLEAWSDTPRMFPADQSVYTIVYTSGIDASIGLRWSIDDVPQGEYFMRTEGNRAAFAWNALDRLPLYPGRYRVDALIPPDAVIDSVDFTVVAQELDISPPVPTPSNHVDWEHARYLEAPFAFDETWEIDGSSYKINEVKVVLLPGEEVMAVVVLLDGDPYSMSIEETEALAKPIARYAVTQGYWDRAQAVRINGEAYALNGGIVITLLNPETRRGNRVPYDLEQLDPDSAQ